MDSKHSLSLEERARRWKKGLMLIYPQQEEIFEEMLDLIETSVNDAAYYRSILNGEHPQSKELLKNAVINLINKTRS